MKNRRESSDGIASDHVLIRKSHLIQLGSDQKINIKIRRTSSDGIFSDHVVITKSYLIQLGSDQKIGSDSDRT